VPYEPSISQSEVHVAHGAVGICTSQLVSGSSMLYTTPQASMNIRGGKVSIQTNADETIIDLLDGDLTVRGGSKDVGGQILRPGERAVDPGFRRQPSPRPSPSAAYRRRTINAADARGHRRLQRKKNGHLRHH
jgi:ferric-dicitrate binding protein FerR (iron transport regulator)